MHIVGPLGAHTSAAGGVWNALIEGKEIGATTVQLFTTNQKQWKGAVLDAETIRRFQQLRAELGLSHLMSHASYLLNLGSPDPEILEKSRRAFHEEIARCQALGLSYLNFHPGAASTGSRSECLDRIVASLLQVEELVQGSGLQLLVETTAGQGSVIGAQFEELAYILKKTKGVGVCLDTCHVFAAGYDIRTAAGWETVLKEFDNTIGLEYLRAFHLNDSLHPLGSRKDRHAPLGTGYIGMPSFHYLTHAPVTALLPKYLETPGGPEQWKKEIATLISYNSLRNSSFP